jgi:integrase
LGKKIWTLSANRMKAGREHRVPLSDRAVAILRRLAETRTGDFVFPGQRRDRPLSDRAMNRMVRRMKADAITTHGSYGSFYAVGLPKMTI